MPRAISEAEIKKILKMIRDWPSEEPITWNGICYGCQLLLGYAPTRQALSGKGIIKNAYQAKRALFKKIQSTANSVPRPRSISESMKKISRLQSENAALTLELSKMAEVANRFIYNASIHGLSKEKLMAPLPKIPRV